MTSSIPTAPLPDEEAADSLGPARKLPELNPKEKQSVNEQSRPSAALIHETIRAEGESELERTAVALLLSGLAAGLAMGFSLAVQGLLHARLPAEPWRELVSDLGYTIGFVIVVLGRQQLFTENTLTPVLPFLHNRDRKTAGNLLRLWFLVLLANVVGTWIFAAVIAHSSLFDTETKLAIAEISRHALEFPFGLTFLKAVFAGWLIALMVWLLPAAESARVLVIVVITYVVALGGFSHIIAGSVDGFYLVETGEATWSQFLSGFFLPTLLGNVLGGVALVAILNYGQVRPELE